MWKAFVWTGASASVRARCLSGFPRHVLLAGLWLLLPGCMVGPNYKAPEPQLPDAWHQAATKGLAEGQADLRTWWTVFNDPALTGLIERSGVDNWQVKEAIYRIREARAQRGIAAGALFPTVAGNAAYDRSRVSANGLQAPFDQPTKAQQFSSGVAKSLAAGAITDATGIPTPITSSAMGLIPTPTSPVAPDQMNLTSVGFDASWEIDVFGGIRRGVEAADASLDATIESYRDLLVSLYAEVALNYMDVRTLQARLAYAQANVDRQRQTLELVRNRFTTGLAPQLDVVQAESNLANSEAEIPNLEAGLIQAINRLGILLGQQPSFLHEELGKAAPIPVPPAQTAVGLPADLLRQRPDIRRAERELAAFTADIGVATADLYPRFSLSGTFALQGTQPKHLGNWDSRAWSFGPAMRWNIFDGVRNLYRVLAARAAAEQARARYEQTVLNALQDVENSMVAYKQEQVRRDALTRAVRASQSAVGLVRNLYQNGLTDFQNVLDTERFLFQQEDQLAFSEGQISKNLVALYKALGGGWSPEAPDTQPAPTASETEQGESAGRLAPATQPAGN